MAALFQSLAQAKRLSLLAVLSLFCWGLTLPAKAICPNATAFGNGFERQLKEEQPTPGEDACTGVWLVMDGEGRIGLFVGNNPISNVDPLGPDYPCEVQPRFLGREGTYGPYVLNIPDGSSLVKTPHNLDPNALFKNESATCKRLQGKSPWAALNPHDEAVFDTPYFEGMNPNDREYYWH